MANTKVTHERIIEVTKGIVEGCLKRHPESVFKADTKFGMSKGVDPQMPMVSMTRPNGLEATVIIVTNNPNVDDENLNIKGLVEELLNRLT